MYLSLHCHHQNDTCIKMGSDESHFNVSVGNGGRQSHRTVFTNYNLFEEKGEPKRYRTEVLPLSSLTPYHEAKQTGSRLCLSTISETLIPSTAPARASSGLKRPHRHLQSELGYYCIITSQKLVYLLISIGTLEQSRSCTCRFA